MALDFVAGCLGGCAGIVVGYPFDTVKVHIQTQDYRNPKYKGTWHCFRTLIAQESVYGLYRGMSSPMAGVAVINAIVFGVYGQAQKYLSEEQQQHYHAALSGAFLAGASAGIAQSPVCSPVELAKTRLQLQHQHQKSSRASPGPLGCLREIHRTEGYRGLFRGLGTTLVREAPSYGVYFATYELLTQVSEDQQRQPLPTWRMLLAGGLAGTASWIVSYPVDVVKSRLQADAQGRYSGPIDCFRRSISTEGYSCMFRGIGSTILRAFPTNAATFAVVTWTMRLLSADQTANTNATTSIVDHNKDARLHLNLDLQRSFSYSSTASDQHGNLACNSFFEKYRQATVYLPNSPKNSASDHHIHDVQLEMQLVKNVVCNQHFNEMHYFDYFQDIFHY